MQGERALGPWEYSSKKVVAYKLHFVVSLKLGSAMYCTEFWGRMQVLVLILQENRKKIVWEEYY
jgi:hypothetical protein